MGEEEPPAILHDGKNHMNVSSIGAGDSWPATAPAQRRPPAAKEAAAPSPEEAIASHLASLDDALETGDLDRARTSLKNIRTAADLPGDEEPGFGDPLSGISKALKSGDLKEARSAWSDFRAEAEAEEQAPDTSISITGYSTFSIVA